MNQHLSRAIVGRCPTSINSEYTTRITLSKSNGYFEGELDGDFSTELIEHLKIKNLNYCIKFYGEFNVEFDGDIINFFIDEVLTEEGNIDIIKFVDTEEIIKQLESNYRLMADIELEKRTRNVDYYHDSLEDR